MRRRTRHAHAAYPGAPKLVLPSTKSAGSATATTGPRRRALRCFSCRQPRQRFGADPAGSRCAGREQSAVRGARAAGAGCGAGHSHLGRHASGQTRHDRRRARARRAAARHAPLAALLGPGGGLRCRRGSHARIGRRGACCRRCIGSPCHGIWAPHRPCSTGVWLLQCAPRSFPALCSPGMSVTLCRCHHRAM